MFGQSFYNNPYQSRHYTPAQQAWHPPANPEYLRALADKRKRRRQWLPDEDDDSEEEWEYNQLRPQERLYLDARKRQEKLERKEKEEQLARERALQELYREQASDAAKRNQILEEHRMRQQLNREEPARQSASTHSQGQSGQVNVQSPPRTTPRQPFLQAEYTERHYEAASRIQQQYRIHRSFHNIRDLESQFKALKQSFVFPTTIDFHWSGRQDGVVTVPIEHSSPGTRTDVSADEVIDARLAYTPGNHALHAYTDAMDKLLMKLDEVESWGDEEVRKKRRDLVKTIEEEASSVERSWMSAWKLYVNEQKEID